MSVMFGKGLAGICDALTGVPLNQSRGLLRCSKCGVYYHGDSVEWLQRENGGRCVGAGCSSDTFRAAAHDPRQECPDLRRTLPRTRQADYSSEGRRVLTILGSIAGLLGIAAGAWFALSLGNKTLPLIKPESGFSRSMGSSSAAGRAGSPSALPNRGLAVSTPASHSSPVAVPFQIGEIPSQLPPSGSVTTRPAAITNPPRIRRRHRPAQKLPKPGPKPLLVERVNSQLRANRRLRRVQASSNGSVVRIFGKVFDDSDRLLAERTVRDTDGVREIINDVTTDTREWDQNQTLINQALQNGGLTNVQAKVIGRNAYLSGQVKSDSDRERAVTIASSAASVEVRENLITVAVGNILGF
jgi:hypothetical protein